MDSPYPALILSNSRSAQHLRDCKRDTARISAAPPYHPDYGLAQHECDDGGFDRNDGERFATYGKGGAWRRQAIDRVLLPVEYIAGRRKEARHYRRMNSRANLRARVRVVEKTKVDHDATMRNRENLNLKWLSVKCSGTS